MNADNLATVRILQPVDLDELATIADLQTRTDRKYLVPQHYLEHFLARLDARALEIRGARTFAYESVYFDTPDFASYLGAARRRPRRFTVRTRTYAESGECMLEVKTRDARGRCTNAGGPPGPHAGSGQGIRCASHARAAPRAGG